MAWTNLERESVVLICQNLPSTLEFLNMSGFKTNLLDSGNLYNYIFLMMNQNYIKDVNILY